MRKIFFIITLMSAMSFTIAGCRSKTGRADNPVSGVMTESSVTAIGNETETSQPAAEEPDQYNVRMVMVEGKLYCDTGKESTMTGRCGVMDGKITSTVDALEIPAKDNQSNFGTGYEYQYGDGKTIEIFMDENWIVFKQRDED